MGFYGKVFYQLANSFGKFIIKNSGIDKHSGETPTIPAQTDTSAIGLDASYTFDTGNRWIKLIPDAANAITTIYHAGIPTAAENVSTTSVPSFNVVETREDGQLKAGDSIQVNSVVYDAAGHVVRVGDAKTFKLPISTVESDISELKTSMETVLANDSSQNSQLVDLDSRCDALEVYSDYIGAKTSFTTVNSSNTITKAIGSIDNLRENYRTSETPQEGDYDWTATNDVLNMSRAILDLDTRVKQTKEALTIVGVGEHDLLTEESTIIEAVNALDEAVDTLAITYQDMLKRIIALEEKVTALGG